MIDTKQVIVVRKDLNMRKGKMCAQAAHASMAFLTKELKPNFNFSEVGGSYYSNPFSVKVQNFIEVKNWLENSFRKICVYVNSEQELDDIFYYAQQQQLNVHLIEDNGVTEFNGVKTKTCLAIGPHWENKFEGVTDHLPLL